MTELTRSVFRTDDESLGEMVFRPFFWPDEILHREDEIKTYLSTLKAIHISDAHPRVILFGTPGTGKTLISSRISSKQKDLPPLRRYHANCRTEKNPDYTLLLKKITPSYEKIMKNRTTNPKQCVIQYIAYHIFGPWQKATILFVIDEVEYLAPHQRDELLQVLARLENRDELRKEFGSADELLETRFITVLLTSDSSITTQLSDNAVPARKVEIIPFPPYSSDQLSDILAARAKLSLMDTSYSAQFLKEIANHAQGNAHLAINLLWQVILIADDEEVPTLTSTHLEKALTNVKLLERSDLTYSQEIALFSVVKGITHGLKSEDDYWEDEEEDRDYDLKEMDEDELHDLSLDDFELLKRLADDQLGLTYQEGHTKTTFFEALLEELDGYLEERRHSLTLYEITDVCEKVCDKFGIYPHPYWGGHNSLWDDLMTLTELQFLELKPRYGYGSQRGKDFNRIYLGDINAELVLSFLETRLSPH